ncbi:MAG: MoaD/ThiS family protein [Nitrospinae bacterium]|nr:MoaD/ThiS family protein [Nitrospinota bacterium]
MAKLLLFASIRERAGVDSLSVPLDESVKLDLFLQKAAQNAALLPSLLKSPSLLYAINGEMSGLDSQVCDSDEVAVLPPLSGGV